MALVTHAGAYSGPRVAVARKRPPAGGGRCVYYHPPGIGLCSYHAGARDARTADVLHPGLGQRWGVGAKLAALAPDVVVTGHGQAMQGQEMRAALQELAQRFDEVALP